MKRLTVILVLVLFGITAGTASADDVTLRLRDEAIVYEDYVRLSALFEELPASYLGASRIRDAFVGQAPAIGTSRVITAEAIRTELRKLGLEDYVLGSEVVRVTREERDVQTTDQPRLSLLIRESIRTHALTHQGLVEVEDIAVNVESMTGLPGDFDDLQVDSVAVVSPPSIPYDLSIPVELQVTMGGNLEGFQIQVEARVIPMVRIAVLSRDRMRYATLTEEDVDYVVLPLTEARGQFDLGIPVIGAVLRKAQTKGHFLRSDDLRFPQIVRRGASVQVTLVPGDGSMVMSGIGRATTAGALGETVQIRMEDTDRLLDCRVTGHSTVKWLGEKE